MPADEKGLKPERKATSKPGRSNLEVVRALSHPVRVRILETLRGRTASPAEISEEMGRSRAVIAYHANTLVSCGCLEIVDDKGPGKDGVEERFAIARECFASAGSWRRTGDSIRCDVTEATMQTLMAKASKAIGLAASEARKRRARQGDESAD